MKLDYTTEISLPSLYNHPDKELDAFYSHHCHLRNNVVWLVKVCLYCNFFSDLPNILNLDHYAGFKRLKILIKNLTKFIKNLKERTKKKKFN